MSQISSNRLLQLAAGGAFGGLISFLVLNPRTVREELEGAGDGLEAPLLQVFGSSLQLGIVVGMSIGACLILTEELGTGRPARILLRTLLGAIAGAFFGAIGGVVGQLAFSILLVGLRNVVVARTLGWCLLGIAAGVCPGLVTGSAARTGRGVLGGALGGAVGGILFDLIGNFSRTGSASRAFGMIVMGAMVGIAVAFVEELAKQYWVVHLTGAREGRTYILSKPETTLGRDEVADIPLFGDFSIQKHHARLVRSATGFEVHASPGCAVSVDSQSGAAFALHDGAIITLGKHRLRFHSRSTQAAPGVNLEPAAYPAAPAAFPAAPAPEPAAPPPFLHASMGPEPVARLDIIGGPHQGQGFWLQGDAYILGRDPSALIPLVRDNMASREHARLVRDVHGWRVDDLGSTNGLFVNGERVSVHWLRPGDQITIGQSVLRAA